MDKRVLEVTNCINGEEWDEWMNDEEHDNAECWRLLVWTAMGRLSTEVRLYMQDIQDPRQVRVTAKCFNDMCDIEGIDTICTVNNID
jgi:PAS domain-containing protein